MQIPVFSARPTHPQPLPGWMRAALWTTALMNMLGAMTFVPAIPIGREWVGLPRWGIRCICGLLPNLYLLRVSATGIVPGQTGHRVSLIAVGALGKLTFFVTLLAGWFLGDLPLRTPLLAIGDLIFGCLFVAWLLLSSANSTKHS